MKKIYNEIQLIELTKYQREVIGIITEIIQILDENYGVTRNIEKDLGGYVVIAENMVDVEVLKKETLINLVPEYTDIIECKEVSVKELISRCYKIPLLKYR